MVGAASAATASQRCATDLRNYHRNVAVRFYAATQNVIHAINAIAKGHTQCRANPLCRVCLPGMLPNAAACPGGHGRFPVLDFAARTRHNVTQSWSLRSRKSACLAVEHRPAVACAVCPGRASCLQAGDAPVIPDMTNSVQKRLFADVNLQNINSVHCKSRKLQEGMQAQRTVHMDIVPHAILSRSTASLQAAEQPANPREAHRPSCARSQEKPGAAKSRVLAVVRLAAMAQQEWRGRSS